VRIVVGLAGSSSPIYGIRTLEALKQAGVETHLVVSDGAKQTIPLEARSTVEQVQSLATVVYDNHDLAASISSGSFHTDGMIVAPCSMKTLAAIAYSFSQDLLVRAADVTLKERRKLVPQGDAPSPRPPAQYGSRHGDGRGHFAAGACLLPRPQDRG
jgi:polyprenyl P-hydroxybenzoate/phenylacrylic acid decarboxylase-like protein